MFEVKSTRPRTSAPEPDDSSFPLPDRVKWNGGSAGRVTWVSRGVVLKSVPSSSNPTTARAVIFSLVQRMIVRRPAPLPKPGKPRSANHLEVTTAADRRHGEFCGGVPKAVTNAVAEDLSASPQHSPTGGHMSSVASSPSPPLREERAGERRVSRREK